MVIGSLLTLIGYHFGNIDNNSADAQLRGTPQEVEIVNEIRCRSLIVVGEDDRPLIILGTGLSDRGQITIYNEDGKPRVALGTSTRYDTGLLEIFAKESGGTAAAL